MTRKTFSIIIGIVFIAVGILGFMPNRIIGGGDALFHTDAVHNAVHIITGFLFLLFALALPARLAIYMKIFGAVYFLLGLLGLIVFGFEGEGKLLGFLHVNGPDEFLHMGLGALIFIASMARPAALPSERVV